ncbi:MAG: glycosyltransferase family 4 protein [Candidatus Bathyarchaeota archaeon]|nr:glycosyltransferase family 4 protein [Candidatus Bathyarchaeota archaeon]
MEGYTSDYFALASIKSVAYVSTYPPRKCGIATFTADLVASISQQYLLDQMVVSIDGRQLLQGFYRKIYHKIRRDNKVDYIWMADYINKTNVEVINIQHEFGIFGGEWGNNICAFLSKIKKPIVTTLHTVLPDFNPDALRVFNEIISKSSAIVVMNKISRSLLESYDVPKEKIYLIPHGCPDVPLVSSQQAKSLLGLEDKLVLSTFGLLSKGKGIEYVIKALPKILKKQPNTVYYILGVTHPQVKKTEGETYRNRLRQLAKDLGVQDHVKFLNRFLKKTEIITYLQASDVYITPYLSPNQVSSGTLSYALGAGKAVVSTPYLHAKEALSDGRGVFCGFQDSQSIADSVLSIVSNPVFKKSLESNAYHYSRAFTWPIVAKQYLDLFDQITHNIELKSH